MMVSSVACRLWSGSNPAPTSMAASSRKASGQAYHTSTFAAVIVSSFHSSNCPVLTLCPVVLDISSPFMARIPLHNDLVALDRAHQLVMQRLALEQAEAWDEGKSKQDREKTLATVQQQLESQMTAFQAEWGRVQARVERQASAEKASAERMKEAATKPS